MGKFAQECSTMLPVEACGDASGASWNASLDLGFAFSRSATRLVRRHHRGPLYMHRPFYPEGAGTAHVYILHPPGGLVSGDNLRITAELGADTNVLFTTPGAGRAYRARQGAGPQKQVNSLHVGEGAVCEWFPQENIIFPGANALLETRVDLAPESRFLGWEITVLGLPAQEKRFSEGSVRQRFVLMRDGLPLLMENLVLDEQSRALYEGNGGMRGAPVSGVFIAGPVQEGKVLASTLESMRAVPLESRDEPAHWGITRNGEFLVVRYLGGDVEQARRLFIRLWEDIRPCLLERPACKPRIWAT